MGFLPLSVLASASKDIRGEQVFTSSGTLLFLLMFMKFRLSVSVAVLEAIKTLQIVLVVLAEV